MLTWSADRTIGVRKLIEDLGERDYRYTNSGDKGYDRLQKVPLIPIPQELLERDKFTCFEGLDKIYRYGKI